MSPNQALLSLHTDYIGSHNANYCKRYFAAQLNFDNAISQTQSPGLNQIKSRQSAKHPSHEKSLSTALDHWQEAMPWFFDLDTVEGYLHLVAEEDLHKVVGNTGYRGQVQAQGNLPFVLFVFITRCSSLYFMLLWCNRPKHHQFGQWPNWELKFLIFTLHLSPDLGIKIH